MTIYTDGSCRKSKVGAYGFISVVGNKVIMSFAKREDRTTNNQNCTPMDQHSVRQHSVRKNMVIYIYIK